jgi:HSP20 family molecular chaperone IbpA
MATNTSVAERDSRRSTAQRSAQTAESAIRPPVDIFEDGDGITLLADMAGVSKERLNLRVDGNSLVLEGDMQFELPQQAEALYADVHATRYRRSFALSRELEADKIEANLKDGVLTVRIPKRAALRPRKIEVRG